MGTQVPLKELKYDSNPSETLIPHPYLDLNIDVV